MKFGIPSFALSLALCSVAQAAPQITRHQVRGNVASTSAQFNDACTAAYLLVQGADYVTKDDGRPTSTATMVLVYYNVNFCTGAFSQGTADLPLSATISLKSAELSFAFEVQNYVPEYQEDLGYSIPVEAGTSSLSGTALLVGVGSTDKTTYHINDRIGKNRSSVHQSGSVRDASVTLSVTLDGAPLELEVVSGSLMANSQGTLDFVKEL